MKKLVATFLACFGLVCATAIAATKGDQSSKASNGAVNVLSSAPTLVFTTSTLLRGRNSFAIYNNGPNTIWCGWSSAVATTTGFPVATLTMLSVDLVAMADVDANFYCLASTADQTSPANTRWIQVK